jgi:hypothetical protein
MLSIEGRHSSSPAVLPAIRLLLCYSVCLGLAACGQSPGDGSGSGGAAAQGGSGGSGGSPLVTTGGSAGQIGNGGTPASGGAISGGGASSTGGATSNGGATSTGGVTSTGGASGASSTGGTTPSGGVNSAGSNSQTGGTGIGGAGKGGNTSSGGAAGAPAGGSTSNGGQAGSTGSGDVTIVPDPSWTCGMPDGIPSPTGGTLVFSVSLTVSDTHDVGNTQYGKRRQLDVSGGTITGDKLKGTVMSGGLDYELTLSNGAMELEEVLIYKTSDNTSIFVRNCGVAASGDSVVRIVPDIEAPTSGSYSWLNTTKLVGTRTVEGGKIKLDIYDVSKAVAGTTKVQLKDPQGVPNTSWDCVGGNGSKGNSVFTENVTLGSSFSVSNAKRGSRNIIPITGGTTTGKVAGKILNGGADYQLAASSGTTLDARYTLAPSDGSFIIVRNCGPIDALVPAFEAAVDGPYKFLNDGKFLSSSPGSAAGGVSITFYERN